MSISRKHPYPLMVTGNSKGVKESMKLNWNFQRCGGGGGGGGGVKIKTPLGGSGGGGGFL